MHSCSFRLVYCSYIFNNPKCFLLLKNLHTYTFPPFLSSPVALQRWIPRADRGDEQAEAEQGIDPFRSFLFVSAVFCNIGPQLPVMPADCCVFIDRTSQPTGRRGVRCWCPARTSSCWSSASGTSLCHGRGPTSMSSGLTSSGWVIAHAVHPVVSSVRAVVWTISDCLARASTLKHS